MSELSDELVGDRIDRTFTQLPPWTGDSSGHRDSIALNLCVSFSLTHFMFLLFIFQTEKFSGAVPAENNATPVVTLTEPEQGQEEEHENMKNVLISNSNNMATRRSRARPSKISLLYIQYSSYAVYSTHGLQ